jgi:hypothetical protein
MEVVVERRIIHGGRKGRTQYTKLITASIREMSGPKEKVSCHLPRSPNFKNNICLAVFRLSSDLISLNERQAG